MPSSHKSISSCASLGDLSKDSLDLEEVQMEALAETFQERLMKDDLVQDRHFRSRTVPKAFFGKDAVNILLEILEKDRNDTVTREQALQVGRDIEHNFLFFCHVKNHAYSIGCKKDKHVGLQDDEKEMYQFHNNLPIQVYKARIEHPNMWGRVRLLEATLKVTTHKGMVRQYKDCFMAKGAIGCLMDLKLVRSRREGAHFLTKMNEKVDCFRLATGGKSDLSDDEQLFRFVPASERSKEPTKSSRTRKTTRSAANSKSPSRYSKSPVRKNEEASTRTDASSAVSKTTKDAAYFRERATGIRSRLDRFRDQRSRAAAISA